MKDLEFNESEKIEWIYDIVAGIMAIIAVLVVMMEFSDTFTYEEMKIIHSADNIIYIIFVLDYLIRFLCSRNKKKFFKQNIIDLIAIFPFSYLIFLQYGSAFKLIRVISYILRLLVNLKEILFTNGFIYALVLIIIITIIGSIGIYIFEFRVNDGIRSYEDALWWSVVTVTTVGYGDILILTRGGRIIACMLMITGVGFLSMLTSTMATFFFSKLRKKYVNRINVVEKNINDKENDDIMILDLSQLSLKSRVNLISYYRYLKFREEKNKKLN